MKRLSPWAYWISLGPVIGGVVIGGRAGILFVADSAVAGDGVDLGIAAFAVVIAGVWGMIGGLVSGALCAAITHWMAKRSHSTSKHYAGVGVAVTVALACPVAVMNLANAGPMTAWDLAVWLLIPVGVSAAVAGRVGRWIWRQTTPGF